MTEGAIEGGRHVIRRHAGCRDAMAGSAIVHDAGMIERCRDEAAGVVTHTAILIGRNVTGAFGDSETRIMTRRAVIHDADMIERCR